MKSGIWRHIFMIFTILSYSLNAQVSVLMQPDRKATASGTISEIKETGSDNSETANSFSSEYHHVKTISESSAFPDLLMMDEGRTTYSDLNKVAANPSSNYFHTESRTVFPFRMGEFERQQIIEFPGNPGKILVIYTAPKGKLSFTISLTPTNEGTEGRLRNEYLKEIKKLSGEEKSDTLPTPDPIKYVGRNYICNGVQGCFTNQIAGSVSQLTVFECGVWLLGFKLKTNNMDSTQRARLDESLTRRFNPAALTALSPLNLKSNVGFIGDSMKDAETSSAMVNSAFKKMDWATRNVSSKERYSGFPDIYLAMHLESAKEYLRIQGKKMITGNQKPDRFFEDLNAISNAGFLPEFIMEEYDRVMIVPDDLKLNFDAYREWKKGRQISASLKEKKYIITYRNLPY